MAKKKRNSTNDGDQRRRVRQKTNTNTTTTTTTAAGLSQDIQQNEFRYSQGHLMYPRVATTPKVGMTVNVEKLACQSDKIKKYESLIPVNSRNALEQSIFRFVTFTGLAGEPLKLEEDWFSKDKVLKQFKGNDKKLIKEVLLYVTRKALRDVFGLDIVRKGSYVAEKSKCGNDGDNEEETCVWKNDKKVYYIVNVLAKAPIKRDEDDETGEEEGEKGEEDENNEKEKHLSKQANATDKHYLSLKLSNEYEPAEYGFLQVVLTMVYTSRGQKIEEHNLQRRHKSKIF